MMSVLHYVSDVGVEFSPMMMLCSTPITHTTVFDVQTNQFPVSIDVCLSFSSVQKWSLSDADRQKQQQQWPGSSGSSALPPLQPRINSYTTFPHSPIYPV